MSSAITRRRFLEGALVLTCIGGGYVVWNRRQRIREQIRDHFPYLRLERGAVRRFISEFEEANGWGSAQTAGRPRLAMKFLLSTDFFHFDADESRTIRYSRLADPYVNPCYNPLARYV